MAESLLLPVVRGVVGKAADALVQKVTRMWGVDGDRRDLELKLLYVQSLLADAEAKAEADTEAGRAVKAWMRELRAAAYQADDVLDDFQYEALRREALGLRSTTSKVLDYFTSSRKKLVFRHKASRDLKNVLDKIHKLVEDMQRFGLLQREPVASQDLDRETHSALDADFIVIGRDNDKESVVKLLLDQQDQRNVQVLPIIGIGGLGKTTLAKMVYNDSQVQNHFELKMWHCVSDKFDAISVVRSVIELAKSKECKLPDTKELLRGKLQEVIGRKRFLLVLDDVWNEDQQKWEDGLKPLLRSVGGSGSIIIVTSRSQKVASIMGTLSPHELACLSEDDSWELFSKKAFSKGVQKKTELIKIGKVIVNKCKRLPLALKTMGGLMSSKHQISEWEAIAEDDSVGKDEVLSILKLSYMHLSSEMKQCFAFCAVFPKDYEMDKDDLIQLWMANGFIHAEGMTNMVQKGELVFNELVWRSFIQDVKVKIFDELSFIPYKKIGCKMHDFMHDLAKKTTDECAFAEELLQQKASINSVRHIQLSWSKLKQEINRLMEDSSPLRTLLTQPEDMILYEADYKVLRKLKATSLRALCWENRPVIHRKLIDLTHLRYLDLSGSGIVRLPDSICMLYSLQSLILNRCWKLELLPEDMQSMRNLTHIYLTGCDKLKRMPPKLSLLHNLCTLTKFIVGIGDGFGIEELKDMRQLGNRLELLNLRKVKIGSKANLHEKKYLTELFLNWGCHREYTPSQVFIDNTEEEVLESLVPHAELNTLGVHGYAGLSISQWMRDPQMFHCLRELYISNCPRCKDLPLVWLSSSLEKLNLRRMDSLSALCKNIDMEATGYSNTSLAIFPKLKTMNLEELPELERWAENSKGERNSLVVFPRLEELHIINCNRIASLPESPLLTLLNCRSDSVEGLVPVSVHLGSSPSLVNLDIARLIDMVMPVNDHQNQSQRRPLDSLRSLYVYNDNGFISVFNSSKLQLGLGDCLASVERLVISSCSNIVRWPLEEFRCLVGLRFLYIRYCNKLEGKGSSEEILPLPQLERLIISHCVSLLETPRLPSSLEELQIVLCRSLVALPSNLGDLAKLRHLHLGVCDQLKALPDGMDGLTSLEQLRIGSCPGIDKFPQGLLQRLSALRSLDIWDNPDLERRCREGGEYFDFVSPIPEKVMPAATEPQMKKSMMRLLPLCGGGDSESN